jgi:hypothetical protein
MSDQMRLASLPWRSIPSELDSVVEGEGDRSGVVPGPGRHRVTRSLIFTI